MAKKIEKGKCKHCEFISRSFPSASEMTNREYWLFTEVFCYLHGNKDECDGKEADTGDGQLTIPDVVGRSEQLVAFLEFIEGYKMLEVDLEYEEIVRRFLGN